jgi:hypothetical protein
MTRTSFAIAIASLIFAAVSGPLKAAPITPLIAGADAGHSSVTHVSSCRRFRFWYGHWHRVKCKWS